MFSACVRRVKRVDVLVGMLDRRCWRAFALDRLAMQMLAALDSCSLSVTGCTPVAAAAGGV